MLPWRIYEKGRGPVIEHGCSKFRMYSSESHPFNSCCTAKPKFDPQSKFKHFYVITNLQVKSSTVRVWDATHRPV